MHGETVLTGRDNTTMKNQERTILGACDYTIASLENIKAALLDVGNPQREINWGMGGVIVTLSSHLMRICHEVFTNAAQEGFADSQKDLQEIKTRFIEFVEHMQHGQL